VSQLNSSILVAAMSLGVKPEELAVWLEKINPRPAGNVVAPTIQSVGDELADAVAKNNPLLAHRWKLVRTLSARSE
jgi:hypothetical protein